MDFSIVLAGFIIHYADYQYGSDHSVILLCFFIFLFFLNAFSPLSLDRFFQNFATWHSFVGSRNLLFWFFKVLNPSFHFFVIGLPIDALSFRNAKKIENAKTKLLCRDGWQLFVLNCLGSGTDPPSNTG